jgi:dihydrodipicolinate synthase/N-acetylneuraminate lyase
VKTKELYGVIDGVIDGVIAPIITPVDDDDRVDEAELRKVIRAAASH